MDTGEGFCGNRKPEGNIAVTGEDESDANSLWTNIFRKFIRQEDGIQAPVEALDYFYKMNHPHRGRALIFNHNSFDDDYVDERDGSEVDVMNLRETFTKLGFEVTIYKDLKYLELMENLKQVAAEDHSHSDCIAVIVMSHGHVNAIKAFDREYPIDELWAHFTPDKCKTLAAKPKLFFIQACRGDQRDGGAQLNYIPNRTVTDGPAKHEILYRIPKQADFLMFFATYPGYVSFRRLSTGSAFISALCQVLTRFSGDLDLLTMMTFVNREVAINYVSRSSSNEALNMKKQMPQVCHTLLRQIYFYRKSKSAD